ncbi:ABC transporter ATP-binding protein [Microbacteriaceae bacterium VKM Ac-2854]|nr:ABC transporter ATP-binding protein [Microbacteriaceae bacterium VKM Ac-2854]
MSLDFRATLAARGFDLALSLRSGETLAVLGPNGAGKSTLLALLAGLQRADAGRAELDGTVLFDGRAQLPPHRRSVSLLAQQALLFPHLSVLDNVAFGPRSTGMRRGEADARARELLRRVDALDLAERRPAQLSGGQAQRIAVARALATDPALLLLDEPMAALDVTVAPQLRRILRDVLAERTAIIVTHEVLDAYLLADRVAVIRDGRIVEEGATRDVLERPRTAFTAQLAGLNLFTGVRTQRGVRLDSGEELLLDGSVLPGASVAFALPPAAVSLGSGIHGTVSSIEPRGDVVRVMMGTVAADLPPRLVATMQPGDEVSFSLDLAGVEPYPLEPGARAGNRDGSSPHVHDHG